MHAYVDDTLQWLHTICNDKATYLYADKKRAFDAINNGCLLIDAIGVLIHDCWSSYFRLENHEHAICLQHIQRELRGAMVRKKDKASYFQEIEDFFLVMRKLKLDAIEAGLGYIDDGVLECLRLRWRLLIARGLVMFPHQTEVTAWTWQDSTG